VLVSCIVAGTVNLPPVPTPGVHLTSTNIPFAGSTISRQARRLYVGNIPFGVTEVSDFSSVW